MQTGHVEEWFASVCNWVVVSYKGSLLCQMPWRVTRIFVRYATNMPWRVVLFCLCQTTDTRGHGSNQMDLIRNCPKNGSSDRLTGGGYNKRSLPVRLFLWSGLVGLEVVKS
jgi:hypothetical protein